MVGPWWRCAGCGGPGAWGAVLGGRVELVEPLVERSLGEASVRRLVVQHGEPDQADEGLQPVDRVQSSGLDALVDLGPRRLEGHRGGGRLEPQLLG